MGLKANILIPFRESAGIYFELGKKIVNSTSKKQVTSVYSYDESLH